MSEKQGNNGKREDCGGEEKIRCGKEEKIRCGKEERIRCAEEEKIRRGILFDPAKPELKAIKRRTHNLNLDYNRTYEDETEKRAQILHEMLGALGEGSFLQGPITFHYGKHTKIGKCFYGNFNLTVQDDAEVVIGDHCDFGPNTTIVTPVHPMVASERIAMLTADGERRRLCYAKPVHIGNGCWFGAGVTVCPGVTVGDGCVIGAGSVVTRDIPANSFAAGVPCRVIRPITEADSMRYKPEILADNRVIAETAENAESAKIAESAKAESAKKEEN